MNAKPTTPTDIATITDALEKAGIAFDLLLSADDPRISVYAYTRVQARRLRSIAEWMNLELKFEMPGSKEDGLADEYSIRIAYYQQPLIDPCR